MNLECKILHLEDSDDDSFLFQRALSRLSFAGIYRRVSSVEAALSYLSGEGDFCDRKQFPLPDMLIIDSSLPGGPSTSDLMDWLKGHGELKILPLVMLTGAMSLADQQTWLERGVSNVFFKGTSMPELSVSVEGILQRCISPAS